MNRASAQPPTQTRRHLGVQRILGVVLLAAVVAAPIDLAHLGLPTLDQARQAVALRYLPPHLVEGVAAIAGWLAWTWIVTTIAAETIDALRRQTRTRRRALHGLAAPIVTLLLTFAPRPTNQPASAAAATSTQPTGRPPAQPGRSDPSPPTALHYVVKEGDNLWDLAVDFYGDGYAFGHIWRASNLADPRRLRPGQTLTIPADGLLPTAHHRLINPRPDPEPTGEAETEQVTVQPGQTLWSISQHDLGTGTAWPDLWAANNGRPEPDGTLNDPNLIQPGWQLTLPHPTDAAGETEQPHTPATRAPAPPAKPTPEPASPSSPARPGGPSRPAPQPRVFDHANNDTTNEAPTTDRPSVAPGDIRQFRRPPHRASGWDLPRLAAEGTVLVGASAVGIWGLRRRLRQQAQSRLPAGQRLAPTPVDEHPITAAVNVEAARAAPDTATLHTALGHLDTAVAAWPAADRPWLVGVRTQAGHAELVFDSPTLPAPEPFTQTSPNTWTLTNPPPPPSPPGPGLIVCVGWQGPAWVWVDLQVPGRIGLTGPNATGLARLWAAQTAGAEICDGTRVTTVDLDHVPGTRTQHSATVEKDLTTWAAEPDRGRGIPWWGDPDRPPAELAAAAHPLNTPDQLGRGVALIAVDDPDANWIIDTSHDSTNIGELGDIHLIQPPPQVQDAVDAELDRAEGKSTQPAPPPPATGPPGDIRVRILGPTIIDTTERIKHRAIIQLAAYLAAHPDGARRQRWGTDLWPETRVEDKTLRNRVFDLRRALGGTQSIHSQHGIDRLNVASDWAIFGQHLANNDPRSALQLVRGEPLADLDAEWPWAEDAPASQIIVTITTTAFEYGQNQLDTNPDQAEWAARQGLAASPHDHRLWTLLLQALVSQGRRVEASNLLRQLEATQPDLADEQLASATIGN